MSNKEKKSRSSYSYFLHIKVWQQPSISSVWG
jgi:hypothetical protein